MKNAVSAKKQKAIVDAEFPDSAADLSDAGAEIETAQLQDDDDINLDDALDDDNENPVSQTLIDAAENRGEQSRDDSRELDGEAEQDTNARVSWVADSGFSGAIVRSRP